MLDRWIYTDSLENWPRCSLLGQLLASVSQDSWASVSLDSLNGVWLSRRSLMNTGSPYRSLNTTLASSRLYYSKVAASRWMPSVLIWSSQSVWGCFTRRRSYLINLKTMSNYETANSKLNMDRGLNTQLYWRSYTTTDFLRPYLPKEAVSHRF